MSTIAPPPIVTSKLLSRQEVAEGTMAFRFERPSNWAFKPGQYLDMTLLDPPETDAEGNIRSFSIASSPREENLMVATRMRNTAFKRVLKTMEFGTAVEIAGPSGDLTLHDDYMRAAVFLAGGIGITPFRSMIFQAVTERLRHHIFLFYSNRRLEDASFLDELRGLEGDNPNFRLIATMTEMEKSVRPWNGETGLINQDMLGRYLKSAASPIYYIAGPPAMVKGSHATLKKAGINEKDIRAEEFAGY